MPTRTINLKMVLGKKPDSSTLRRAMWTTHEEINKAVAKIERTLLLCRGKAYWTLDDNGNETQVPESSVITEALKMAREAQMKNGGNETGSDEEILNALRLLYEQIVPSCKQDKEGNPLKGDAQSIGSGYAGPLFDPDTCAVKEGKDGPFAETASKCMAKNPPWLKPLEKVQFKQNNPAHFKHKSATGKDQYYCIDRSEADDWSTKPAQEMLFKNKAFNKDKWKKEKDKGEATWAVDFVKKQLELSEDPRVRIRKILWEELRLLPLGSPFFDKNTVANLWNRLAFRLAVAHLLSWESWNHRTQKEHNEARAKLDSLERNYKHLAGDFDNLREYERERHEKLKRTTFAGDDRPFKIFPRIIRAWPRVREEWLKVDGAEEKRKQIIKDLQTKLRGGFGDPDLFQWLAEDSREHLWRERDSLTPLVKLNVARRLLEKRKEYSLMTFADSRWHPRWTMYEGPGGSNLRKYSITCNATGLQVKIPLICLIAETGSLQEKDFSISLAGNAQLSNLSIEPAEKGKKRFKFRSGYQDFEGIAGGAELLFDRSYIENGRRTAESLSERPGPVWLKLTLDVQSKAPGEWLDGNGRVATPPEAHHFRTALSNKSKHIDKLKPGLRVLSVDLGQRTFASCSVFELVEGKPEKGLFFPAADGRPEDGPSKLWAKHLRSFKLALPGETTTQKEKLARRAVRDELHSLKRDMGHLKDLLRLGEAENDVKRDESIETLLESLDKGNGDSVLNRETLHGLGDVKFKSTPELWRRHCLQFYDKAEKIVSERFSQWRKRTRPKSSSWQDWRERRNYHGGKSIWMLEYLDDVRKLILSWNLRGRTYGAVNRQNKKQFGTVASGLLRHINQLKEDRVKAGADLIIQAARGYVPVEGGRGWIEKHESCRVILFEDLARYRFRVDRPRRENSRLMKWNHREIIREAKMQAEIYGVKVETTAAGFSSRYLASNGAPGVRCRCLKTDDFERGLPKPYVVNELDWMLEPLKEKIQPGMWVPWSGGELFASIKSGGAVHLIHADINAAQNLQRRFWSRCGEAFRISCRQAGDSYELAKLPGHRLLGALQQLENGDKLFRLERGSDGGYPLYEMMKMEGKKLKPDTRDESGEDEYEEATADLEEDSISVRETFFRDPSGNFFDPRYWIPSKSYWTKVRQEIWKRLQPSQTNGILWTTGHDDLPL